MTDRPTANGHTIRHTNIITHIIILILQFYRAIGYSVCIYKAPNFTAYIIYINRVIESSQKWGTAAASFKANKGYFLVPTIKTFSRQLLLYTYILLYIHERRATTARWQIRSQVQHSNTMRLVVVAMNCRQTVLVRSRSDYAWYLKFVFYSCRIEFVRKPDADIRTTVIYINIYQYYRTTRVKVFILLPLQR